MQNDEPIIKSTGRDTNVFAIVFSIILFSLAYPGFKEAFEGNYFNIGPLLAALFMSALGIGFLWSGINHQIVWIYENHLQFQSLLFRSKTRVNFSDIKSWSETKIPDKGETRFKLVLYTSTGQYNLHSKYFDDYVEVKDMLTHRRPLETDEKILATTKNQRLAGLAILAFSLIPLAGATYFLSERTIDIRPDELTTLPVTLAETLTVTTTGRDDDTHNIYFHVKEYPDFNFRIADGQAFKAADTKPLLAEVHRGDSIYLDILTESVKKKITHQSPLGFFDKHSEYDYIDIYGLRTQARPYLLLSAFNAQEKDAKGDFIYAVIAGVFFCLFFGLGLWAVWRSFVRALVSNP